MDNTIDSIQLEIEVSASKAVENINGLTSSLRKLDRLGKSDGLIKLKQNLQGLGRVRLNKLETQLTNIEKHVQYLIHHDKQYLEECRKKVIEVCTSLGIVMNAKKTQIVKLSRGFRFLKMLFRLSDTGRVLRKPTRKGITAMRRKLKIFRRWVDEGKMTFFDVNTSYQSWRGHLKKSDSHNTLKQMDKLFKSLFKEELSNERPTDCTQT